MDRERIVRRTSAACYAELVKNGALPLMRRRVYRWLYENGPATRNEIANGIEMVPNDCSTRLKELCEREVVREVGEDRCRLTGKNVNLYDVTDSMPRSPRMTGVRTQPEVFLVGSCAECLPLEEDAEDAAGKCWMDMSVSLAEVGRPLGCPLLHRDFIVRAKRS